VSSSDPAWIDVVERIDGLPRSLLESEAFRHQGPAYQPLNTEGAQLFGGRWNPPDSFPVLYLALSPAVTAAELRRLAARNARSIEDLLPRRLHRYNVRLYAVLDLTTEDALETLGITQEAITSDDLSVPQRLGEAAHYVGFEAILAPSAAGQGVTLSVFFDVVRADSEIQPLDSTLWESVEDLPKAP
jgi:RES domain-containing protein